MADPLTDRANKYTGKLQIGKGPVPLQRWQRPLLRVDRDRPNGAEGVDLRPERPARQGTTPPPDTRTIYPVKSKIIQQGKK